MSGRLGAVDLLAVTDTLVYTVPVDTVATVNINVTNRNALQVQIRVALVDGVLIDLADEDYIEYDIKLCDAGVLERTGVVMSAGQSIVVYSDTANVSAQVWGWEEGT